MNFFKLYIGDYQRDTGALSIAEHGAYLLMLQHFYATEQPLPMGRELHRLLRAESKADRDAIDRVAEKFWALTEEGWVNHRAEEEIQKNVHQRTVNREVGKRGGRPKRTESVTDKQTESKTYSVTDSVSNRHPNDNPNHSHSHNHKKQEQDQKQRGGKPPGIDLPDWVPPDAWADWHAYRNSRKGWTAKARELSLRTLQRLHDAGHDPRKIIETSIERGWTALFAPRDGPSVASSKPPIAQQFAEKTYHGTPDDQLPAYLRSDTA